MKKYYMKLYSVPFKKIKDGTKTIEMRLNDDKRKLINIGDTIEFKNIESGETLLVEVTNKYIYEDYQDISRLKYGFPELISKYQFDYFIVPKESGLASYLKSTPDYSLIYQDKKCSIFKTKEKC